MSRKAFEFDGPLLPPPALHDGVNDFLASVFVQMAGSLLVSALAALSVAVSPGLQRAIVDHGSLTPVGWLLTLSPVALALALGARVERFPVGVARICLPLYAAIVGLSLGSVFYTLAPAGVVATFLASAAGFGALAGFARLMTQELSGWNSFLASALTGLLAAVLVNSFLRSTELDCMVSAIGVLLFCCLTAIDTGRLKQLCQRRPTAPHRRLASLGALTLYLDCMNLMLPLPGFAGRRR